VYRDIFVKPMTSSVEYHLELFGLGVGLNGAA